MHSPKTFAILWLALAAAPLACSGDTTSETLGGNAETASLELLAPLGTPACIAIGDTLPAALPIQVSLSNATLRPQGACGSSNACGHLLLTIDGKENARSAAQVVMLQLARLADPYHDGQIHAGTGKPDLLDVKIELVNDAGESWLDDQGMPILVRFDLAIVSNEQTCP
jgi:hypothetical protein